jgi:hypothetical protein
MTFIKARYRCMGSKPTIDINGLYRDTIISITPGTAYALRDALSAALDDYEKAGQEGA